MRKIIIFMAGLDIKWYFDLKETEFGSLEK